MKSASTIGCWLDTSPLVAEASVGASEASELLAVMEVPIVSDALDCTVAVVQLLLSSLAAGVLLLLGLLLLVLLPPLRRSSVHRFKETRRLLRETR